MSRKSVIKVDNLAWKKLMLEGSEIKSLLHSEAEPLAAKVSTLYEGVEFTVRDRQFKKRIGVDIVTDEKAFPFMELQKSRLAILAKRKKFKLSKKSRGNLKK